MEEGRKGGREGGRDALPSCGSVGAKPGRVDPSPGVGTERILREGGPSLGAKGRAREAEEAAAAAR